MKRLKNLEKYSLGYSIKEHQRNKQNYENVSSKEKLESIKTSLLLALGVTFFLVLPAAIVIPIPLSLKIAVLSLYCLMSAAELKIEYDTSPDSFRKLKYWEEKIGEISQELEKEGLNVSKNELEQAQVITKKGKRKVVNYTIISKKEKLVLIKEMVSNNISSQKETFLLSEEEFQVENFNNSYENSDKQIILKYK